VTAYSQYALEAFQAYPLDYVLKPIDEMRFRQTISHVVEQVSLRRMNSKGEGKIHIRCFGKFEVVKSGPQQGSLPLTNRKMKEILAYLIYRFEKPVFRKELLDLFFNGVEDKKTVNYLHVIIYNIRKALESFGLSREQVLIRKNYTMVIAPGICDYVDFVKYIRKSSAVNETNVAEAENLIESYRGSYLEEEDYCWAFDKRIWLDECCEKIHLKLAEYYESAGEREGNRSNAAKAT